MTDKPKIPSVKFGRMTIDFLWLAPDVWRLKIRQPSKKDEYEKVPGTENDAKARAYAIGKQFSDRTWVEKDTMTIGTYISQWIEENAGEYHSYQTTTLYRRSHKNHIMPAIGHIPIQELMGRDIQLMYADLRKKPTLGRVGLAQESIQKIRNIMSAALREAVEAKLITVNPLIEIATKERKLRQKHAKVTESGTKRNLAIRKDDAMRLLAACNGWLGDMIKLAYGTGMRRAEICGLRWGDIDLEAGVIHVRQQVQCQGGGTLVTKLPKHDKKRAVDITPDLVALLRVRSARAAAMAIDGGHGSLAERPVFVGKGGRYMIPESVTQQFRKSYANKLNLRTVGGARVSFHDLRHGHATALLDNGAVVKYVSERLGHATVKITTDYYQSVTDEGRAAITRLWGSIIEPMTAQPGLNVVPLGLVKKS
jgi:integrase